MGPKEPISKTKAKINLKPNGANWHHFKTKA